MGVYFLDPPRGLGLDTTGFSETDPSFFGDSSLLLLHAAKPGLLLRSLN